MGPSGSGKSTLLTLLAGHEFAAEGTLRLNGRAYDETTSASVGFVPQQDRGSATHISLTLP
jgi:ABC-type sulfate/molybdate transport systems ATPase subunit